MSARSDYFSAPLLIILFSTRFTPQRAEYIRTETVHGLMISVLIMKFQHQISTPRAKSGHNGDLYEQGISCARRAVSPGIPCAAQNKLHQNF